MVFLWFSYGFPPPISIPSTHQFSTSGRQQFIQGNCPSLPIPQPGTGLSLNERLKVCQGDGTVMDQNHGYYLPTGKHTLQMVIEIVDLPSGKHTKSYWKWPFIVSFPVRYVTLYQAGYPLLAMSIMSFCWRMSRLDFWSFLDHVSQLQLPLESSQPFDQKISESKEAAVIDVRTMGGDGSIHGWDCDVIFAIIDIHVNQWVKHFLDIKPLTAN